MPFTNVPPARFEPVKTTFEIATPLPGPTSVAAMSSGVSAVLRAVVTGPLARAAIETRERRIPVKVVRQLFMNMQAPSRGSVTFARVSAG